MHIHNNEVRSDPCILDPSQVVILFILLWPHILSFVISVHIL